MQGLTEKQEIQRLHMINKVLRVVADIKSEGGEVRSSILVEYGDYSGTDVATSHKRKNSKQDEIITEKKMETIMRTNTFISKQ